ncbi:hypothetical protein CHS0354_017162 [Potamilus streckersoni]|uniref:Uncharacterized protein n=1 Tax=Potamilus streckersoni TaxID=2493646 RepID=A0AAE0T3K0_9BIVA|nr:hypothetical protein CHS0354_017162 [Potamilus streckersoni]
MVYVIPCPHWPSNAYEWISSSRTYGWPTKQQIREIVNQADHIRKYDGADKGRRYQLISSEDSDVLDNRGDRFNSMDSG